MASPLITVIIPTYNRATKVLTAIKSVKNQSYGNVQLIVVDDGSTDNTGDLLSHIDGLTYIYKPNGGQASARNAGLQLANGDFIASLDSDDYWERDFLEKAMNALNRYHADFAFANWNQKTQYTTDWRDFLSSDPYLVPYIKEPIDGWYRLSSEELRALYLKACPSPSSSVVMRRQSMVGGWDNHMNIGDDWGLYLDMIFAKPCAAVFTLERLWYKDIDGQNIYDGRSWHEVVQLLLVKDTETIMKRYRTVLSVNEMEILRRRYIKGLMELAKHKLIREKRATESWTLVKTALGEKPVYAIAQVPKLAYTAFNNHFIQRFVNLFNIL
ncbi:glycosyltransferase family 2 protein [Parapedobacter deserti]|uniref:Glycosyltransferase family 2 protein n=1 Tax=Parapedobacter deserti TaxID=1912957 RepID=A0ABV7JLH1_9SPHI